MMKSQITLKFIFACLILSLIFLTTSCKKDIEGCTDINSLNFNIEATVDDGSCVFLRDKIVGDWDAVNFFVDGNDAIFLNIFQDIEYSFDNDGTFEWSAIATAGDVFEGGGDWVVQGDFLEIDFDDNSDSICGDREHRFSIDFDGDNELNLEDNCNSGTFLVIVLRRN